MEMELASDWMSTNIRPCSPPSGENLASLLRHGTWSIVLDELECNCNRFLDLFSRTPRCLFLGSSEGVMCAKVVGYSQTVFNVFIVTRSG